MPGYAALPPGGADVCGPAAVPPWGRSTEATAARPPGGPTPLVLLSSHRAGLESAGSPVQVRGERSLTGPRGHGLASTTGQLGTTQTTHVYLWGHFSLPGTPAGGSVPCLLGTAPFSPLGAPLLANSTTGWTPELSGGGAWLRGGQDASPAPSPAAALPVARALPLDSSLFTATRGRNQMDGHRRGR